MDRLKAYHLKKRTADQAKFQADQATLRAQHQLPNDCQIIRVVKKGDHKDMKPFSYGCVAFVDAQTGKLICCACFIPLDTLDAEMLKRYNHLVFTVYRHGLACNIVRRN